MASTLMKKNAPDIGDFRPVFNHRNEKSNLSKKKIMALMQCRK
jgi:hypothetical protein